MNSDNKTEEPQGQLKKTIMFFNEIRIKLSRDCINNYAASASFYIFLSIFPFLILLLTIIQYTPITEYFLTYQLRQVIPETIAPLLVQIIYEIYNTTSGAAIISVSAVLAIWSASKAMMSITRGINAAYDVVDTRNYFLEKLMSCLYVIIFTLLIVFVLILLIFGRRIYTSIHEISLPIYMSIRFILRFRIILMFIIMTLIFTLIYTFMPAGKHSFLESLPGAVSCSLGWTLLSQILSLYVNNSTSFTYFYGSLTTLILMMLWFYISMYIIFICAEINYFFGQNMKKRRLSSM